MNPEDIETFWDHAHLRTSVCRLGATKAHQYTDYFSKVGPFAQDLAAAEAVLDVGPGMGAYLRSVEDKERYAIDVSDVSRKKAGELGATPFAPGEIGASLVDLATCLSVTQHCPRYAVELIFADVFRALRSGGQLYVNGIVGTMGNDPDYPGVLVSRARCCYMPDDACKMAESAGLTVASQHVYKLGSTGVWILYCVKP